MNLHVLGTNKKYTCQPIVRTPMREDGPPDPNKYPHMKNEALYPTHIIRTVIVEQTDDGGIFVKTDTPNVSDL